MREIRHSFDFPECKICPLCGNRSCVEGEYVDVGVGSIKCSPDCCNVCGYSESSPHREPDPGEFTFEMVQKCWELQVWPFWTTPQPDW